MYQGVKDTMGSARNPLTKPIIHPAEAPRVLPAVLTGLHPPHGSLSVSCDSQRLPPDRFLPRCLPTPAQASQAPGPAS